MKNEKRVKDEPHSEFTKEEQQEFLNLLDRITPEQREALKKVLKSFIFVLFCTDHFLFAQSPCTLVHKGAHGNLPH